MKQYYVPYQTTHVCGGRSWETIQHFCVNKFGQVWGMPNLVSLVRATFRRTLA